MLNALAVCLKESEDEKGVAVILCCRRLRKSRSEMRFLTSRKRICAAYLRHLTGAQKTRKMFKDSLPL